MPAAEQELPSLLQRFEHEHSGSVIRLCMSKAMTNNRSVLAIPTNTSQEPKMNKQLGLLGGARLKEFQELLVAARARVSRRGHNRSRVN
jgi:hypothetical protein